MKSRGSAGRRPLEFSRAGQALTLAVDRFPVPVIAAIRGYCMGGGMDLALACDYRIAAPNAVFGHRGASLGVMTGWGGTQRLPRLIGKARAMQMFLLAEMVAAEEALRIGLVNKIADDPVADSIACISSVPISEDPFYHVSSSGKVLGWRLRAFLPSFNLTGLPYSYGRSDTQASHQNRCHLHPL